MAKRSPHRAYSLHATGPPRALTRFFVSSPLPHSDLRAFAAKRKNHVRKAFPFPYHGLAIFSRWPKRSFTRLIPTTSTPAGPSVPTGQKAFFMWRRRTP